MGAVANYLGQVSSQPAATRRLPQQNRGFRRLCHGTTQQHKQIREGGRPCLIGSGCQPDPTSTVASVAETSHQILSVAEEDGVNAPYSRDSKQTGPSSVCAPIRLLVI